MSYISATIPQTTDEPISTIGTDNVFVELHLRRMGALIELRAVGIEYSAFSGKYLKTEIGVELADDEEVIDAADDLQRLAYEFLDEREGRGYSTPCGFGSAVQKIIDSADVSHAIAAE